MKSPARKSPQAATGHRYTLFFVFALTIFALTMGSVRYFIYDDQESDGAENYWSVTLDIKLNILDEAGKLFIEMPWDTRYVRLYGQSVSHLGMKIKRSTSDEPGKRKITLLPTAAGSYAVRLQFSFYQSYLPGGEPAAVALSDEVRARWLDLESLSPKDSVRLEQVLKKYIRKDISVAASSEVASAIYEYISGQVQSLETASSDGLETLSARKGNNHGRVHAMVLLLRAAQIPARVVTGIDLESDPTRVPVMHWVEAHYDDSWHPFDLVNARADLPESYVPFARGSESVISTGDGIEVPNHMWLIENEEAPIGASLVERPGLLSIIDLTHLPEDVQQKLALMLLLPLGLLATEIMRKLFGVMTFGVFTPTLVALAAVYVEWTVAVVMFALVVSVGVAGRSMIPKHEMGRDARLSMVFVLVTLTIIMSLSALLYFDFAVYDSISILPVVILASLVDRIYAVIDQKGLQVALYRLVWTTIAAMLSVAVLSQNWSGDILLV